MKNLNPSISRSRERLLRPLRWVLLGCLAIVPLCSTLANDKGSIHFIIGPSKHPPGTHEVKAGARLMTHCLEQAKSFQGVDIEIHHQWPSDFEVFSDAKALVFNGDQFPPARFSESEKIIAQIEELADRGCSFVAVHYGVGVNLPAAHRPEVTELLSRLFGGYAWFVKGHKDSTLWLVTQSTITPESNGHPITRGVGEYSFNDEPYFRNRFPEVPEGTVFTPLATSMMPPDDPRKETVAWSVEHRNGGRGFAIVMPHFFINWTNDDFRKMVLNGIVWAIGGEVPENGIESTLPSLEAFEPEAVHFTPREKK